jgi:CubicO group peptidase (beta-lactamase class C family)
MARFGLLLLNKGKWNSTAILNDTSYFQNQVNSSQSLNLSYGYLTWLNGKSSHMLPSTQALFSGSVVPNAPADMYAALGKNDQKIYVVPSMNIVVIRMGNDAGNGNLALSRFDNELWEKLNLVIK